MSQQQDAFQIAKDFVGFVESRNRQGIDLSLADDVRQIFPMAGGGWTGLGAVYEGKQEVLAYTYGLLEKFDKLVWIDKVWSISADGARVFMEAKSEAIVTHSKAPYRNTYVTRFDVVDGKITQILEYAIAELFIALGTEFSDVEQGAIQRAQDMGPEAKL